MELLVIRHALPVRRETEDGSPADPPLDELGRRQAVRLAEWLAVEAVDAVVSSPMRRARETAAPLAERLGVEPVVEDGVAEFDRDAAAYVPLEELKATEPELWLELVQRGGMLADQDPVEFQRTVVAAMEGIVAAHPGRTVAVVCHGGVVNAWASHVIGIGQPFFFEPIYTSISRFRCSSRGHRSVVSLNEVAHLRGLPSPGSVLAGDVPGGDPAPWEPRPRG